jgi:hypothetical protein
MMSTLLGNINSSVSALISDSRRLSGITGGGCPGLFRAALLLSSTAPRQQVLHNESAEQSENYNKGSEKATPECRGLSGLGS